MEPISRNKNDSNNVGTHTYWLTPKEYRKMAKKSTEYKYITNDNTVTRTHLYFE